MAKAFECHIVDGQGRKQVVSRQGPGEDWVLRELASEGFFVLSIKDASAVPPQRGKLRLKDVIDLTETLSTLLGNGLTLKETLKVASEVFPRSRQERIFRHLSSEVSKGLSLHQSLQAWAASLPPLYLGLIRIGEKTGDLSNILKQLAEYLQTRKALKDKTGNALVYPAFVLGIAVLGLGLLMVLVFPTLTSILGNLNAKAAAAYATNLAGFQAGASVFGLVALALAAGAVTVWVQRRSNERFRQASDAFVLRVPLLGSYLTSSFGLNFSFAVSTLLAAGYSLEETLAEAAEVITNRHLRHHVVKVREGVLKGKKLSAAFQESGVFPQAMTGWVLVGEGAHDLKRVFAQLQRFYQQDLDRYHHRFLNLVEPAMIVLVGGLLVFLVLTFITPVFTMLGNLL